MDTSQKRPKILQNHQKKNGDKILESTRGQFSGFSWSANAWLRTSWHQWVLRRLKTRKLHRSAGNEGWNASIKKQCISWLVETKVWNLKVMPDAICGCFSYLFDKGAAEKISRQFLHRCVELANELLFRLCRAAFERTWNRRVRMNLTKAEAWGSICCPGCEAMSILPEIMVAFVPQAPGAQWLLLPPCRGSPGMSDVSRFLLLWCSPRFVWWLPVTSELRTTTCCRFDVPDCNNWRLRNRWKQHEVYPSKEYQNGAVPLLRLDRPWAASLWSGLGSKFTSPGASKGTKLNNALHISWPCFVVSIGPSS